MHTELDQLRSEVDSLRSQFASERRRLRVQAGLAFVALVGAIFLSPANRKAIAQGYGVTLQQLAGRVTAVETKNTQQDAALNTLQSQVGTINSTLAATKLRAAVIYPDGAHPFNQNITVTHTGPGNYHIVYPAGSFNNFGIPVLTPFNTTGSLSSLTSPGDGSITFDVQLGSDAYFDLNVISIN